MLVTIDPPGLAPLFLAVTGGMNRSERMQVAVSASIAFWPRWHCLPLPVPAILSVFGITLPAFRVAGGLLLFYIAFEMIFERRQERHEKSAERAITTDMIRNVAAFPLAIPLIAGPGAISAAVLLSGTMPGPTGHALLVAIIALCIGVTFLVFVLAERVDKFLGKPGGRS
jgi:multiple antibiotic resistance protein